MTNTLYPNTPAQAIEAAKKSISKVSKIYTKNHFHLYEDIRQEAVIGCLVAFEKWMAATPAERKASFATYAHNWIWHHVKQFTQARWKDIELTRTFLEETDDTRAYDMAQDLKDHDLNRQADNVSGEFRAIFDARMAGYTFKEIADEMGYKTQFVARNIYMQNVDKLEA